MVTPSMVQVEAVNRTTWPLATTAVNPRMLSLARVERVSGWERERGGGGKRSGVPGEAVEL